MNVSTFLLLLFLLLLLFFYVLCMQRPLNYHLQFHWLPALPHCRYLGYTLSRESGLWHSTIASMFVGMVIVIMAVYTRQRTIGLVPVIKAAQD